MNDEPSKVASSAVEFTKPGGNRVSIEQLVGAGQEYHRRRPYASEAPIVPTSEPATTAEEQATRQRQSRGTRKATKKKDAPVRTAEQEQIAARLQEVRKARTARRRYVVNLPLVMLENLDILMLAEGYLSRNDVVEQLLTKALKQYDLAALRKTALGE